MPALFFTSPDNAFCQLTLDDARLPEVIQSQLTHHTDVWFHVKGMVFDDVNSEILEPSKQPLFFEWQRLEWLYEIPGKVASGPYALYVNNVLEPAIKCREIGGRYRLTGSINLGNAVGKTHFSIRDVKGKDCFALGAEVFPQKLDYKEDFPAMIEEVTEIIYSLAFDVFKKTYASATPRSTYQQTLSEWLNLYKVLATSFEQSIDTILRSPKSRLQRELRTKPVDRVKRVTQKSLQTALKKPERYCRGGGFNVTSSIQISHLQEQHKQVSYDTQENRFVVWAIKDVIKTLSQLVAEIGKRDKKSKLRLSGEVELLKGHQRKLRFRLMDPALASVGKFDNEQQFSTTLTMAPGYKEFYHRYLLLRKGLTLSDNDLFNMDYKDIATLYEYWCFLKTVKLLRDNPKYNLAATDIVKIEHQKFSVNLKKGVKSGVHFKQVTSGDDISLYYNREFSSKDYTHTFSQIPDNFIEFSRSGYANPKDKKTFKVVLDAKYRFDKGSAEYPEAKTPFGPPLDTISQLHRYRDAILWQEGSDESVKVANKSIGGVILFPYPKDEMDFKDHPFYKSIDRVNIGAIPLQPGRSKKNALYNDYLNSLFEQSGEVLNERRIRFDSREYDEKRQSQKDLVMVGLVPKSNRELRLKYHEEQRCFYTQWNESPAFPLEKVKRIALYDQAKKTIYAWADVESVEVLLGDELKSTGTTWAPRALKSKHCVYRLGKIHKVALNAGEQMSGHRNGRYFITRLGLELAIENNNSNLLFVNSWKKYQDWKDLTTKFSKVSISRKSHSNTHGQDDSELTFTPVLEEE